MHRLFYVQRAQETVSREGGRQACPVGRTRRQFPAVPPCAPDRGLEKPVVQKCQWAQTDREELLSLSEGAAWQDGNT